ncbi:hypothetical protein ACFLTC_03465 [Chloroflexota bacterium]
MGLDLWFRDDVARILASAYQTMQASAQAHQGCSAGSHGSDEALQLYRQGFTDALRALALAFGLAPSSDNLPRNGERRLR